MTTNHKADDGAGLCAAFILFVALLWIGIYFQDRDNKKDIAAIEQRHADNLTDYKAGKITLNEWKSREYGIPLNWLEDADKKPNEKADKHDN